ncbi:hypothetical protein WJ01_23015 [Burkholderia vietnamiensis]|nr:hypothetical protein WJ01_23015 [Burkholderia vietnamiensis]
MLVVAHAETTERNIRIRADIPSGGAFVQPPGGWRAYERMTFDGDAEVDSLLKRVPLRMESMTQGSKAAVISASLAVPALLHCIDSNRYCQDGSDGSSMPFDVSISSDSVPAGVKLTATPQVIYRDAGGREESGVLAVAVDTADPMVRFSWAYEGVLDLVFDFSPG